MLVQISGQLERLAAFAGERFLVRMQGDVIAEPLLGRKILAAVAAQKLLLAVLGHQVLFEVRKIVVALVAEFAHVAAQIHFGEQMVLHRLLAYEFLTAQLALKRFGHFVCALAAATLALRIILGHLRIVVVFVMLAEDVAFEQIVTRIYAVAQQAHLFEVEVQLQALLGDELLGAELAAERQPGAFLFMLHHVIAERGLGGKRSVALATIVALRPEAVFLKLVRAQVLLADKVLAAAGAYV